MADEKEKNNDLDLNSFDIDVDLDNPFAEEITVSRAVKESAPKTAMSKKTPQSPPRREEPRKRSSKDFNPDMEALLLTAQSSMIIDGMQLYTEGNFSSSTLPIYMEALKGVSLYIKILDRNPNNYNKLKALIDADSDCKEVEDTAFSIYKRVFHSMPETEQEKLIAFEKFEALFKEAIQKASISNSMKLLKKYLLLSGSIDEVKIKDCINRGSADFTADIKNIAHHVKLALELQNKGKCEIAKGLKGRDINIFVIKASYLLYYFYTLTGNEKLSEYFGRIHSNYKKYFIIRD